MNSSVTQVVAEKRNSTTSTPDRVKAISSSHNMPFAWCIQANQAQTPVQQRPVVVMNCPPETYLG